MVADFTPEAFYDSAREFAESALQAHHTQQYRRVALDAGTVLEHLAKACLASRSPVLLAELRDERSYSSLLPLLGIPGGKPLGDVRTVSLRNALQRLKKLVTSKASDDDLQMLIDMRDGTVHAAADEQIEERILVAFIQHVDALLLDLKRDRAEFWGDQLVVVDTLLGMVRDKIAHRVSVKLASARVYLRGRYGDSEEAILQVLRKLQETQRLDEGQEMTVCPVCDSFGVLTGDRLLGWESDDAGFAGVIHSSTRKVWFQAQSFMCRVCRLHLDSVSELEAAKMEVRMQLAVVDTIDFNPPISEDRYYEWLDDHCWEDK